VVRQPNRNAYLDIDAIKYRHFNVYCNNYYDFLMDKFADFNSFADVFLD
jgi:hypothetical protein